MLLDGAVTLEFITKCRVCGGTQERRITDLPLDEVLTGVDSSSELEIVRFAA
jgi:hypothetical protein